MANSNGKNARKQHGGNRYTLKRENRSKLDKKFAEGKVSRAQYQTAKAQRRARLGK